MIVPSLSCLSSAEEASPLVVGEEHGGQGVGGFRFNRDYERDVQPPSRWEHSEDGKCVKSRMKLCFKCFDYVDNI